MYKCRLSLMNQKKPSDQNRRETRACRHRLVEIWLINFTQKSAEEASTGPSLSDKHPAVNLNNIEEIVLRLLDVPCGSCDTSSTEVCQLTEQTWAQIDVAGCTSHAGVDNSTRDCLSVERDVDGLAAKRVVIWVGALVLGHDVG